MLVSAIIPVYNAEDYLRECIESLLAQNHTDMEIILVDDGSTDSSGRICDEYAARIRTVKAIHKVNAGQAAARNTGLDVAQGEYIMFVDADDMIHPSFVSTVLASLKPGDIGIAGFRESTHCRWDDVSDSQRTVMDKYDAIEQTLYQRHINCSICGKLFPASIFRKQRFVEGLYYEDLDIFYRLYENASGDVVLIDHPMYFYRKTPGSFINTFASRRLDVLKVVDKIEEHYRDRPKLLRAAHDRKFSANCNMLILSSQAGMADIADRCWSVIRSYRGDELKNTRVRLKNKLGAVLSYLGKKVFLIVAGVLG